MEGDKCPVCGTERINQVGIDELIDYSLNVTYWEEEAAKMSECIARMRSNGKDSKEREFKLWLFHALKVQNNYLMFTPIGRQRDIDEPLNNASLTKMAQDLADRYEEGIRKMVRR